MRFAAHEGVGLAGIVPFLVQGELVKLAADYSKGEDWQPRTVQAGLLITGQNPASSGRAADALIKLVSGVRGAGADSYPAAATRDPCRVVGPIRRGVRGTMETVLTGDPFGVASWMVDMGRRRKGRLLFVVRTTSVTTPGGGRVDACPDRAPPGATRSARSIG